MSYPVSSGPEQPPQYGASPPSFPPGRPPWEQPASPPPPAAGNGGLLVGLIAAIVALICVVCGVGGYFASTRDDGTTIDAVATPRATKTKAKTGSSSGPKGTSREVRYEVAGRGTALVTWTTDGNTNGNEDTTVPWNTEVAIFDAEFGLKVSAYGKDAGGGTPIDQGLSCKIFIDGIMKVSRTGAANVECETDLS